MSDAWFDLQLLPDGSPEDGCHPQEAAALKEYLNSTTTTADTAARSITLPVASEPHTPRKGQVSDNLPRLWGFIINALTDLPDHRRRIIQLLQAIQNLPTSNPGAGENEIRWTDLPGFGHLWADLAVNNSWRSDIDTWPSEQREGVRQEFIRQATVEAQLVVADLSGMSISCGLGCICDALERSDAVPDFEVPAAKEWLELASDRIFAESDGPVEGFLRERDLWKHKHLEGQGRKQRWHFWKQRLHLMAESEELTLEIRDAARKAVEAMDAVGR